MIEPSDILVWMQTTVRRDSSKTIHSIECSDIGIHYEVRVDTFDRKFPADYPSLQQWWTVTWYHQIKNAEKHGCKYILRLEDDIVVNAHILHNLCRWSALQSPKFGVGTLFVPDYWEDRPELMRVDSLTQAVYRSVRDVEGAQGQLLRTADARRIIEGVPLAIKQRRFETGDPHPQPSFDWSVSRSAAILGLHTFVHLPALVNLHEGSLSSKIDQEQHNLGTSADAATHYWGGRAFNANWRAP